MSSELFSITGKTALVTGASSGLGEHFARVLAGAGAEVVLAARRADKLDAIVKEINDDGGKAHSISMDVSSAESVVDAFNQVDELVGELDILINNAGVNSGVERFTDVDEDSWNFVIDTNLNGAYRVARQAASRMAKAKQGCIVNTGSIYGLCTGIRKSAYNVSKVAMTQLTKNMALELARSNVRVNALCPGYFGSAINDAEFNTEKGKRYIQQLVPQRLGLYPELDGPLLLLVSDAGSFVNGITLPVDGGTLLSPI